MTEIKRENLPRQDVISKIIDMACNSLYRNNASTARFYSFTFLEKQNEWQGGWCWSHDSFDGEEYSYCMDTGKFYQQEKY